MNEIDNFKFFVFCSDDVVADVDHLQLTCWLQFNQKIIKLKMTILLHSNKIMKQ
jgi:hypothetical protein